MYIAPYTRADQRLQLARPDGTADDPATAGQIPGTDCGAARAGRNRGRVLIRAGGGPEQREHVLRRLPVHGAPDDPDGCDDCAQLGIERGKIL